MLEYNCEVGRLPAKRGSFYPSAVLCSWSAPRGVVVALRVVVVVNSSYPSATRLSAPPEVAEAHRVEAVVSSNSALVVSS